MAASKPTPRLSRETAMKAVEKVKLKCECCEATCSENPWTGDIPPGWNLDWIKAEMRFAYFCPGHRKEGLASRAQR